MSEEQKLEDGQEVSVHYVGTLDDGTEFDNSRKRNEPLVFKIGEGGILSGFNNAVSSLQVGETKSFRLDPEEAYGFPREDLIHVVPNEQFADYENIKEGMVVFSQDQNGQPLQARVEQVGEKDVTVNFNHMLAGQSLTFEVELLNVA